MKWLPSFLLIFSSVTGSWAQVDSSKVIISLSTHFEGNANTVPNTMLSKLLWGGYMSKEFLTDIRDKLHHDQNRFGFEFKNQVSVKWKGKQNDWVAGLKYRELLGMKFPKDLFGLAFLGNGAYEGQTADLSNIRFGYIQYSGASFGVQKSLQKGKKGVLYAGISALYGFNYQSLKTNHASLYTAPDAAYIQSDGDMNLRYRQPRNGWGAGVDLSYTFTWKKNTLFFSVEDFGFMHWQNVTQYEGHSSYTYRGEEIANIATYTGDSLFSDFSTQGFAKRFGMKETQQSLTTFLPFAVTLRYQKQLTDKWRASLQGYYTYIPAYIPRLSAKVERVLPREWNVNAGVAYGGFGRENLLVGCNKNFAHHWSLSVDGFFLGMVFLPASSHGIGANLTVRKGFW